MIYHRGEMEGFWYTRNRKVYKLDIEDIHIKYLFEHFEDFGIKLSELIDVCDDLNIEPDLDMLAKKNMGVSVTVFTFSKTRLSQMDIDKFNKQYPVLTVKKTDVFHDRFLIIDEKEVYHIGASIKDSGNKCFGISVIQDKTLANDLIKRLKTIK